MPDSKAFSSTGSDTKSIQLEFHDFFTQDHEVATIPTHAPVHTQEDLMEHSKEQFRIQLTPEQKTQVRNATGKDAEAVELSVEELEERIAPGTFNPTKK
jgi:hypothetical protein